MKIGLCGSIATPGLKALGFDYIEENVQEFLVPEEGQRSFIGRCRGVDEAPKIMAANCFLPGALKCVGPGVDTPRILRYAESAFSRAAALGLSRIVFGSGGSRGIPEGFPREQAFAQFTSLLRELGPLAARHKLVIVVEPLNRGECNFINSLAEGAAAVEAAGQKHVALLCDLYHMAKDGEGPEAILAQGRHLRHAHIAEKERRTAPGVAGDDFGPYLKALKSAGYEGAISMECNWESLENQAPAALRSLREQLSLAGFH